MPSRLQINLRLRSPTGTGKGIHFETGDCSQLIEMAERELPWSPDETKGWHTALIRAYQTALVSPGIVFVLRSGIPWEMLPPLPLSM